ncbi:hypothetical protein [Streptomyces sp. PTD9-10]|uniref:hypothetical protein n=1 Tax=Streptomyces sp. PTD9-10 TaxID=3120151 RepID=UPI00300AA954
MRIRQISTRHEPRSSRTSRGAEIPQGFPAEVVNLSCDLTDEDLGQLIKALDEYGLIGRFQGLNQQQRLDEIRKISDKGLLAAMIKAVTGSTLRQKVISEYNDLAKHGKVYQWAYAMVCLFNSEIIFRNKDISTTNLLEAIAYPDVPTHTHLAAIEGLQEMGLLLTTRGGALRCRQRTCRRGSQECPVPTRRRSGTRDDLVARLLCRSGGHHHQ